MSNQPSPPLSPFEYKRTESGTIHQLLAVHDEQLSELCQRLSFVTELACKSAEQINLLTEQLAEANLRILFIFETFKFAQKGTLLDAAGNAQAIQKTLGDLYVMGRDDLLTKLEQARQEHADGESLPSEHEPAGSPSAQGASAQGDGDSGAAETDEDGFRAPLVFPDRVANADSLEGESVPVRTPGPPRVL